MPQAMPSAPHGTPAAVSPVHDNSTPPPVMNAIPRAMRRSKFSLNTNHASSAVRTPSRFSSREAEAAGVCGPVVQGAPRLPPGRLSMPFLTAYFLNVRKVVELDTRHSVRLKSQSEVVLGDEIRVRTRLGGLETGDASLGPRYAVMIAFNAGPEPWEEPGQWKR